MNIQETLIDQDLFDAISPVDTALIIKVLIVITFVTYTIFAFILTRQMSIKRGTVETPLGPTLSFIASAHFVASILLTIGAIVVL